MLIRLLLALLLLGGVLLRSFAGWMIPLTLEEMRERADLILQAKVTGKNCERHADGHIITRIKVDVSEVLKGSLKTNKFEIVYNGGTIGNETETSSIQAHYDVGEETVVFLRINDNGEAVTVGVVQGKFLIWEDKATGEKFAHNPFHGTTKEATTRDTNHTARLALRELINRAKGAAK